MSMNLTRNAAIISMAGLLIALTGPVDAARPKAMQNNQVRTISGIVVHHRGKPVAGAYVHVMRQRGSHHAKAAGAMAKARAKAAAAGAVVHRGVMTGANGTFSLKAHRAGMVMLVAHKKNVGKGHARAVAGGNVMIRLHKHHHHHS